ncbi:Hypothetical protein GLP15_4154 [Giardia lamblia P15]|uniref:Uncharacterized protein n=1 Tax=Giardia intestinalis (strain P15) TaxID=658858 RepID=E1F6J5_GIAIA|nr:Hypothetical protein GLP15_4154 [Giardia lamblia P15]
MVEGSVCTNSRGLSHGLQLCPLQDLQAFLDVACPSPVDCCAESAVALRLLRFLSKKVRCGSTSSPTLVESAIGRTQSTELLPLSPQDIHKEWCQLIYIGTCELAPSAHTFCTVYETDGPCGASSRLWTGDACSSAWRACRWIPAVALGPGGGRRGTRRGCRGGPGRGPAPHRAPPFAVQSTQGCTQPPTGRAGEALPWHQGIPD